MTSLSIARAEVKDSGTYTLKLSNQFGQATLGIKLTVIGKVECVWTQGSKFVELRQGPEHTGSVSGTEHCAQCACKLCVKWLTKGQTVFLTLVP